MTGVSWYEAAARRQFSCVRGNPNPSSPSTLETTDHWTKERVTIDVGYGKERMAVYLVVPRNARPPFQPLVYFPGIGPFQINTPSDDAQPGFSAVPLDYLVKSGRVLIQPIYQGSYERWSPLDRTNEVSYSRKTVEWRWDLGRTIDGSPPRNEVLREALGWLDKYLGPVR